MFVIDNGCNDIYVNSRIKCIFKFKSILRTPASAPAIFVTPGPLQNPNSGH